MRLLIMMCSILALAHGKPEMYKEKEDFQFSRSSSDEGSKSGYYGAQRGNMGGNYEKAHNMDSLAQHQMSTLVRHVDGELGEGANTRTGSVYTAGNSRGFYGSGNYDLTNLHGRNFQEGVSYGNSHSQSSSSSQNSASSSSYSTANSARYNANQLRASGLSSTYGQTGLASQYGQFENQQANDQYQRAGIYEHGSQGASNYKYYAHSGSQAQNYDDSSKSRLISTPMKIYVRPGTRVTIPVAAQTYDASLSSVAHDQNTVDTEADLLSTSGQHVNVVKPKHFESSYSYRKEWEKHDTQPVPVIPTENPFPTNSEFYEDSQLSQAAGQRYQSELDSHVRSSGSQRAYTSNVNSGYTSKYSANTKSAAANQYQSQQQSAGAIANSNVFPLDTLNSGIAANSNDLEDTNSRPKSYHSSYSYHKSWERRGDPYIIKPVGNDLNGQASQRLLAATADQNLYSSNVYGNHYNQAKTTCDELCHIRKRRSYNLDWKNLENLGQQTQNQWDNFEALYQHPHSGFEELSQQPQNQLGNLEDLGQQTQDKWDNLETLNQNQHPQSGFEELSQQPQNLNGNLEDLGQQTQDKWDNLETLNQNQHPQSGFEELSQQPQNLNGNLEDLGQQTQDKWDNLETLNQNQHPQSGFEELSQQPQNLNGNLEDLGQQTQDKWDNLETLNQNQHPQSGFEELSQKPQNLNGHLEDLGQQTQDKWDNLETLNQNQHPQSGFEELSQQPQNLNGNIEDLGQQTQDKWDNLETLNQNQHPQSGFEELSQQPQNQLGNLEDLGQQTQSQMDHINDLGQQTQNTWDNLEKINHQSQSEGQQSQSHWHNLESLGQEKQIQWNNFENSAQQTQNLWDKFEQSTQQRHDQSSNQQTLNTWNKIQDQQSRYFEEYKRNFEQSATHYKNSGWHSQNNIERSMVNSNQQQVSFNPENNWKEYRDSLSQGISSTQDHSFQHFTPSQVVNDENKINTGLSVWDTIDKLIKESEKQSDNFDNNHHMNSSTPDFKREENQNNNQNTHYVHDFKQTTASLTTEKSPQAIESNKDITTDSEDHIITLPKSNKTETIYKVMPIEDFGRGDIDPEDIPVVSEESGQSNDDRKDSKSPINSNKLYKTQKDIESLSLTNTNKDQHDNKLVEEPIILTVIGLEHQVGITSTTKPRVNNYNSYTGDNQLITKEDKMQNHNSPSYVAQSPEVQIPEDIEQQNYAQTLADTEQQVSNTQDALIDFAEHVRVPTRDNMQEEFYNQQEIGSIDNDLQNKHEIIEMHSHDNINKESLNKNQRDSYIVDNLASLPKNKEMLEENTETTEKPGFWKSVWYKTKNVKDSVASWFKN